MTALTQEDLRNIAQAMNRVTGLATCHSGNAEELMFLLDKCGLSIVLDEALPEGRGKSVDDEELEWAIWCVAEGAWLAKDRKDHSKRLGRGGTVHPSGCAEYLHSGDGGGGRFRHASRLVWPHRHHAIGMA